MIHNIPKPNISPCFTIEDIHIIREWHYEQLKDAKNEEAIAFFNNSAKTITDELAALRQNR
jgi:hypothetical protein